MNRYLIAISLLTFLYSCKETMFIVKNEDGKFKVEKGMSIAITKKGESYPFEMECESTCKECDPLLNKSRWIVDTISTIGVVLKYERTFKFDTIDSKTFNSLPKKERQPYFYKVIAIEKKAHYVFRTPVEVDYMKVGYDTLETITYSYSNKCYKGSPIKAIFANPNKIRRVNMKDAEVNVKFH